jgi:hypothetical protein
MVLTTVGHPTTQPTPPVTHPAAFDSIGPARFRDVAAPIAPLDLDIRVFRMLAISRCGLSNEAAAP